jgi:hypothetical protein
VAFLSAAAEGEAAADIPSALLRLYPTFDGQPHGALTDALLRVLHGHEAVDLNGDGRASLHEIHQTVGHFMSRRAYGHSPQRLPSVEDDQQGVGNRPLLSGRNLGVRPQQVLQSSLTVAVADGVPSGVRRTVTTLPGITLSAGADADLRVVPASPPGHLSLLTRQGDLIATFAASDVTRLTGQIQQLVWAENLDSLARRGRRDALAAEIAPAALGGNFLPGDRLHFAVRPDRDATVLLLNANAEGKVSVLYPFHGNELAPLPGSLSHRLPSGPAIVATEPLGLDLQFLFAFDAPPPGLAQWVGRTSLVIGDPSLGALQDMVKSQAGRYTYVRTELRVLPPPAHP